MIDMTMKAGTIIKLPVMEYGSAKKAIEFAIETNGKDGILTGGALNAL